DAKVFPLWNGPGTVKVIVIDAEKKPANINLISSVVSAIETNRPIGATVTVAAAQAIVIDIKLSLTKNDAYTQDQVKDEIIKNITGYLQSIAFKQDYVSYAQIGNVIMSSRGVNDYSNLTVNNGIANIAIGVDQVAVPGVVTL
ncbi:MAG TPA: baseplate J/gp47 family protein, partial [Ruminiclostridium sp.]|nr:baseplate J/gp47 family protein [Ruminiclostridium sp.]